MTLLARQRVPARVLERLEKLPLGGTIDLAEDEIVLHRSLRPHDGVEAVVRRSGCRSGCRGRGGDGRCGPRRRGRRGDASDREAGGRDRDGQAPKAAGEEEQTEGEDLLGRVRSWATLLSQLFAMKPHGAACRAWGSKTPRGTACAGSASALPGRTTAIKRVAVGLHEAAHTLAGRGLEEDRRRLGPHLREVRFPDRLDDGHAAERHVRHLPERLAQPLHLLRERFGIVERLVLEGRVRLRNERVHRRHERAHASALPALLEEHEAQGVDEADDVIHVAVGLAREADLQVELELRDSRARDQAHLVEEHLVGDLLVDRAAEAFVAGLGRDRERALALRRQDREDLLRDRVDLHGRKGDVVAEARKSSQNREDLRVVRDGRRDEARARRERAVPAGDLEHRLGRHPHLRGHRVGGPAEAAHLRTAPRDLDEELVRELGVRREERRVRRLAERALGRLELLDDDLSVLGALGARAVDRRDVEALERPRGRRGWPRARGRAGARPRGTGRSSPRRPSRRRRPTPRAARG